MTLTCLGDRLIPILEKLQSDPRQSATALSWSVVPLVGTTMRTAYFANTEMVAADKAVGRISADLIAPYPPGVAVVAPGEILTEEIRNGLGGVEGRWSSYRLCDRLNACDLSRYFIRLL